MREIIVFLHCVETAFNIHLLKSLFWCVLKDFFIQNSNLPQSLLHLVTPFLWNAPEIPSPGRADSVTNDRIALSTSDRSPGSCLYWETELYT